MKFTLLTTLLSFSLCVFAQVPKQREAYGDDGSSNAIYAIGVPENTSPRGAGYYTKDGKYGFVNPKGIKQEAIYDEIKYSSNNYIIKQSGLYGLADRNGIKIGNIEYDSIGVQLNSVYVVKKKNKYGTLSSTGKPILSVNYRQILFGGNKLVSLVKRENGDAQIIFNAGEKAYPEKIDFAYIYANLAVLKVKGKFGIVKNQTILPFEYDSIYFPNANVSRITSTSKTVIKPTKTNPFQFSYSTSIKLLAIQKNGKVGLVDSSGRVIFSAENDEVYNSSSYGYYSVKKDKLYGLYFINSGKKTPLEFEKTYADGVGYIMAVKNKKAGVFNMQGDQITPFEYDDEFIMQYQIGLRVTKNKKIGIVDKNGKIILPPIYDDVDPIYNAKDFIKVKSGEKYGLVDIKGETIIPTEFNWISAESGYFEVATYDNNMRMGLYDKNGKIIIPVEYRRIYKSKTENSKLVILMKEKQSYNFLNREYKAILKENVAGYGYILDQNNLLNPYSSISRRLLYVKDKLGKFGLLNEDTETLVAPMIYDSIIQRFESRKHTYLTVKKAGKFGLINEKNEVIVPIQYDSINIDLLEINDDGDESSYTVIVSKNKRFGTINLNNIVQIPLIYSDLQRISTNQLYKAKLGKYYQVINSKNEVINKGPFDEVANFEMLNRNSNSASVNQTLTFYEGKMRVLNEKGNFLTTAVTMQPHNGYKTFDELKFALIEALDSKNDNLLKDFAEKIAPSEHLLYYLKDNLLDNRKSVKNTDISYVKEKYFNDLIRFKTREWNSKSTFGYKRESLTEVTDFTLQSRNYGVVTNARYEDHAFGDTRFIEKLLRNSFKINGYWISSYFMFRNFDEFRE